MINAEKLKKKIYAFLKDRKTMREKCIVNKVLQVPQVPLMYYYMYYVLLCRLFQVPLMYYYINAIRIKPLKIQIQMLDLVEAFNQKQNFFLLNSALIFFKYNCYSTPQYRSK